VIGADRPCPDDLLARARAGGLSELERRALTAHLVNCGACATSAAVAALFREGGDSLPADASIVARVARRAGAQHAAGRRAPRWSGRAFALATVTLLLVTSGALAWVGRQSGGGLRSIFHRRVDAPTRAETDHRSQRRPASVEIAPLPPALDAVVDQPVVSPAKRRPAVARLAGASVREPPTPNAAALFADANATRRRGDLRGAVSLYEVLRRQFPATSEARLSAISMADVLLDLGSPARALDAYGAYLSENASGSLREEALFGRTRCLHALDRGPDELDTWRALVREFPRSAYAPLGRRRIAELQR
jgi:hypothetical protein